LGFFIPQKTVTERYNEKKSELAQIFDREGVKEYKMRRTKETNKNKKTPKHK